MATPFGRCQIRIGAREGVDLIVVAHMWKRAQLVEKGTGPHALTDKQVPCLGSG